MRTPEHPVTVDAVDAVEASEVLELLARWLAGAGAGVAVDWARHLGPEAGAYPLGELVADLARLAGAFAEGQDR